MYARLLEHSRLSVNSSSNYYLRLSYICPSSLLFPFAVARAILCTVLGFCFVRLNMVQFFFSKTTADFFSFVICIWGVSFPWNPITRPGDCSRTWSETSLARESPLQKRHFSPSQVLHFSFQLCRPLLSLVADCMLMKDLPQCAVDSLSIVGR